VCGRRPQRQTPPRSLISVSQHTFVIEVTRPFCDAALLAYLRVRAIKGVELVEGSCYSRTIRRGGKDGVLTVDLKDADRKGTVAVRCSPALGGQLDFLRKKVDRLIDAAAPVNKIDATLGKDPLLSPLVLQRPGVRIPGSVYPFELAVRAILGQQISVAAAVTLAARVAEGWGPASSKSSGSLGRIFPEPGELAKAELETIGLTRTKALAIRRLANATAEGQISLDPATPESEKLLAIPGIGPWTAAYIHLRGLGEGDSIPLSDLGLRNAARCASPGELAALAESWRPWRGYAAMHLWCTYLPL
jgi:AraC family transcriptional regulator of adaptative response / DNA-3-methyladenine glycosylase II